MSIIFSDTSGRTGLLQRLEDVTGTQSSTGFTTAMKTSYLNQAYAWCMMKFNQFAGVWQVDDSNQTDLPIMTFTSVSGQFDYNFLLDATSNKITEIYEVQVKDLAGNWRKLKLLDYTQFSQPVEEIYKTPGLPEFYDPGQNGFFVYPPFSSANAGAATIKVRYARTPVYFATSGADTRQPGFADAFHDLVYLRAGYSYLRDNRLPQKDDVKQDMKELLDEAEVFFGSRARQQKQIIRMAYRNPR